MREAFVDLKTAEPVSNARPGDEWAACLVQIASKDKDAFAQIYAHFAPRLKGYLMRLNLSADLAEEVAQEAMVNVWRKAHLFDPAKASATTWIYTIARNLRIDYARRQKVRDFDPDAVTVLMEDPETPDAVLSGQQKAEAVRAAVAQLPPNQAEIVRMAFFQGLTHQVIAAELDLPLGTVKSRIRLAFGRMKDVLEDVPS